VSKTGSNKFPKVDVSRRQFLATGLAAVSIEGVLAGTANAASHRSSTASLSTEPVPTAPFDTLRDYIAAMEAHGQVVRLPEVDQDAYELTALMYQILDDYGMFGAPIIVAERIKIDGKWVQGPVIGNVMGPWDTEALTFGLDIVPNDGVATYRNAKAHFTAILEGNGGSYPLIPPVEVSADKAHCKEVILRGDDIDLTKFAFIQTNPGDSGRYINTGSVFTKDPEMGMNFGTYRCQLRGPREIGVNPEPRQTGWRMLMAARERGEKTANVSIALGQDPMVWMISAARVSGRVRGSKEPIDELAVAGGFRGKPLEVIRSETNDMLVPAQAEMIIEGEVSLTEWKPEGPFGEMYGYLGRKKEENFWMNVTAVTHRRDPWLMNSFTGVLRGHVRAPLDAISLMNIQRDLPEVVDWFAPNDTPGVVFIAIKKTEAGQGLKVGKHIAETIRSSKIMIVVDDDLDVTDRTDMVFAMGSRWQPYPASYIYEEITGMLLDPSSPNRPMSSKIVIDATRQWPEEGGPEVFPELNRALLERLAPESFARADAKWGELIRSWAKS
jgi:4-hydroxy-3-polyprenylbenzoate decarboxylase